MTSTVVTPLAPSEDEYGIVATFSEPSLHQLSFIQSQLSECLGDTIWLTPRSALHSTLMEIICDKDYTASRKQLFDAWYAEYNQAVADTLAGITPFYINFDQLEVSPKAIIARLSDSRAFNDIRNQILSKIGLPEGTKMPPDITHCTLARFTTTLSLEEVAQKVKTIEVNFTEHISIFELLKDLGPPTFQPKHIHKYPLLS